MIICSDVSREPDLREMVTFCLHYLIIENSKILYHYIAILFYLDNCHIKVNDLCIERHFRLLMEETVGKVT